MPQAKKMLLYRPKSWDDVVVLGRYFSAWVFRGVADTTWPLTTSIERTAERYSYSFNSLPAGEKRIVEKFQGAAHLHFPAVLLPERREWLNWMSLIQHYGGPTRLLDFTESFYCAAFFALEKTDRTAAIWAVNRRTLESDAQSKFGISPELRSLEKRRECVARVDGMVDSKDGHRVVIPFFPEKLHERLANQQGLFLAPGSVEVSFRDQLLECLGLTEEEFDAVQGGRAQAVEKRPNLDRMAKLSLLKIELAPELQKKGRRDLRRMNLTSASLFPGPDGYAKALHWELGNQQPGEPDFVPQNASTRGPRLGALPKIRQHGR